MASITSMAVRRVRSQSIAWARWRAGILLLAGLAVLTMTGCFHPRVSVEVPSGWATVTVEVADTDAERARGLMERPSLPDDEGMLFVYPEAAEHLFWMEDTLIPLDMLFIGADDRVVGIVANAAPRTRDVRGAGWISRAVLEVNGGWARERGVRVGAQVRFSRVSFPPAGD